MDHTQRRIVKIRTKLRAESRAKEDALSELEDVTYIVEKMEDRWIDHVAANPREYSKAGWFRFLNEHADELTTDSIDALIESDWRRAQQPA